MRLDLSFVVLLAGYLFLIRCNLTRFVSRRRSGYHLLFGSGVAGVVLLAISYATVTILPWPAALDLWNSLTPKSLQDPLSRSICLSFLLGVVSAILINRMVPKRYTVERAIIHDQNRLEILLVNAMRRYKPVEIVLKGGVFYMGNVTGIDPPSDRENYVEFLPLLQGFMNPLGAVQSRRKCTRPQKIIIPFGDIQRARELPSLETE